MWILYVPNGNHIEAVLSSEVNVNTVRPRRKPYRSSTIKRVNVNTVRPNGNHIEAVLSSEVNVNTVRPRRESYRSSTIKRGQCEYCTSPTETISKQYYQARSMWILYVPNGKVFYYSDGVGWCERGKILRTIITRKNTNESMTAKNVQRIVETLRDNTWPGRASTNLRELNGCSGHRFSSIFAQPAEADSMTSLSTNQDAPKSVRTNLWLDAIVKHVFWGSIVT